MKWIKVEDALPEKDGEYITNVETYGNSWDGVIAQRYVTTTIRGKTVRRWKKYNKISPWKVTHWMRMPEPPKD